MAFRKRGFEPASFGAPEASLVVGPITDLRNRLVVVSIQGTACTDNLGNTWTLDASAGDIRVWSRYSAGTILSGFTVTVTGALGLGCWSQGEMEDDDYLDVIASKSGSTTVLKGTSFEDEIAGPCAFSPVEEGLRISLTDLSATPFFLTTTHTPIDSTGQAQRWNLVEGSGHYWDIWGEPPAGTAGTLTLHVTWTSSSNPSSQDYDIAYDLLLVGYRPIGSTRAGDDGGDEGDSPWNLETRLGQYHIAYAHSSGIKYRQSDFPAPPFAFTAVSVTATAGDDNPRMAEILHERSLVRLVFQRSGVVYRTDSYDDGASWSDPVTLFSAGSHPTIAYDPRSLCTLYACYHGGALKGRLQEPGDSEPGAEYAFTGIDTPADDSFHIAPAGDAVGTWMLVMKTGTSIKNYRSTDEGVSWSEVT